MKVTVSGNKELKDLGCRRSFRIIEQVHLGI